VLRAFTDGIDGVLVGGCHFNECHYITDGNYHALAMVLLCKKLMQHVGLNPDRLRLESVSAGEGIRFAEIMNEFGRQVQTLGPVGAGEGLSAQALSLKLAALTRLVPYLKLVQTERLRVVARSEEAYRKFYAGAEFDRLFRELIADKLAAGQILLLLKEKARSTGEISQALGLTAAEVSRHLNSSSKMGLVRYDESLRCFALA
jgi:DNA-binding transcriptional ArsR family regulator